MDKSKRYKKLSNQELNGINAGSAVDGAFSDKSIEKIQLGGKWNGAAVNNLLAFNESADDEDAVEEQLSPTAKGDVDEEASAQDEIEEFTEEDQSSTQRDIEEFTEGNQVARERDIEEPTGRDIETSVVKGQGPTANDVMDEQEASIGEDAEQSTGAAPVVIPRK